MNHYSDNLCLKFNFKSCINALAIISALFSSSTSAETCPLPSEVGLVGKRIFGLTVYTYETNDGKWEALPTRVFHADNPVTATRLRQVFIVGSDTLKCQYDAQDILIYLQPSDPTPVAPILGAPGNKWEMPSQYVTEYRCDLTALTEADPNYCPFTLNGTLQITSNVLGNPFN
jgi:hypothetical protein